MVTKADQTRFDAVALLTKKYLNGVWQCVSGLLVFMEEQMCSVHGNDYNKAWIPWKQCPDCALDVAWTQRWESDSPVWPVRFWLHGLRLKDLKQTLDGGPTLGERIVFFQNSQRSQLLHLHVNWTNGRVGSNIILDSNVFDYEYDFIFYSSLMTFSARCLVWISRSMVCG